MTKKVSDELLMKRLSRGDKNAAGILYDRYHKKLYGYFMRMTKDAETSRDLTQNVFLKILKYSKTWKEDKVFAYWTFRIARNILVDHYRSTKNFFAMESETEIGISEHTDSIKAMEAKESYEFLLEAMAQLPPGYREMIELNRFQGFSYKEIAATVSSTESAVRVKTFRAIQKLKEVYTKIIMN